MLILVSVSPALATVPISIDKDSHWLLRLPKEDNVAYKGDVNFDRAGANNLQMMYPAPSAIGFLAAVFTHGAIVDQQKKSEKDKLQEEANKVLTPYASILKDYTNKELMQRTLDRLAGGEKRLLESDAASATEWVVASVPIFTMTQDQSAIIVENAIAIYPPNATVAVYQNAVKVVSQAKDDKDLTGFWSANGGAKLKEESAALLAHSIEIALNEAATPLDADSPQKTFRYQEGNAEKIERAQLVSAFCQRAVIRTLRGWLMSVPIRTTDTGACRTASTDASAN